MQRGLLPFLPAALFFVLYTLLVRVRVHVSFFAAVLVAHVLMPRKFFGLTHSANGLLELGRVDLLAHHSGVALLAEEGVEKKFNDGLKVKRFMKVLNCPAKFLSLVSYHTHSGTAWNRYENRQPLDEYKVATRAEGEGELVFTTHVVVRI